ncbi:MAG TPA: CPBP family intramembrane glutamic endopeptidase [Candidatus Koribacter sp.]|jgi:hypothetical protein
MSTQIPPIEPNETPVVVPATPKEPSMLYKIFVGPYGVRAGWKILIFIAVMFVMLRLSRPLFRMLPKMDPKGPMTPGISIASEFFQMTIIFLATGIMAKLVDRKPWGYFHIPLNKAFGANFWKGAGLGLGALTLQLAAMHLCGWFDFGVLQLHGFEILKYGAIWAFMFLLVGLTEEGLLRGYLQRVTTDGLSFLPDGWGFWVAAVIFSTLFAAGHLGNPGENKFGIVMVFIDGMAMCVTLWYTGDLWFAIGNHMAWDWGQSFLFGTPDSGYLALGRLMAPSFHGPALLAGGTDGPEGSLLVLGSEALFFIVTILLYRRRHYPLIERKETRPAEVVTMTIAETA